MRKSTIYLSDELHVRLRATAAREGRSQAAFIRESIELNLRLKSAPRPTLPLFTGAPEELAACTDDYLAGFGEQ